MNNNRRRNFRSRPQKNNFRRRTSSLNESNVSNFGSNGNLNFNRNGSMSNPHFVEKTMQKFQQLAKDAQSSGDLVLVENYLQHADHYSRRLAELSVKIKDPSHNLIEPKNNSTSKENSEVSSNQKQVITK